MMFQAKSIGIDIRPDSVRVAVATASQGGRTKILQLLEKNVPAPPEGEVADPTETIKEALREIGSNGDVCVACLPVGGSINRLLTTPLADSAKIKQTLKFQIEPQIPYPVDQVISDFISIRTMDEGTEILAVAVTKATISERLKPLKSAGVDPNILTLDALALADLYITPFDFSEDRVTALLLPDSESSFLGFFMGEKLLGYRTLEGIPEGEERDIGGIVKELRRSLLSFRSSTDEGAEIGALCVGGGGEGLREYLQDHFRDITVRNVEFNEKALVEISPEASGSIDNCRLAIALARIGIETSPNSVNFMQDEYAPPSPLSHLWPNIKFSLLILAALALIWFAGVWAQIYGHSEQLKALNEEMMRIFAEAMPGVDSPMAAEQRIRQEKEKFKSLKNYSSDYVSPLEVLHEVAAAVPDGMNISLNDLAASDSALKIIGVVDSFDDIDAFKKRIDNSPLLSDVKIESATKSDKAKKVTFRIRAHIEREAAGGSGSGGDS